MSHRMIEFHNIMPVGNIPSVLEHGVLSHANASQLKHYDVSSSDVQNIRNNVQVPGGLKLHNYANLYFDAYNPMMSARRDHANNLCVLGISTNVLRLENVVITDQNAASNYVAFWPPSNLNFLDFDMIYAKDWRHEDRITYWRHKSKKCAEILIPHSVSPNFILKAYVVSNIVKYQLLNLGFDRPIEIKPGLFFR